MGDYKKITKLSPLVSSQNLGDFIIDEHCQNILDELFENAFFVNVPTHDRLSPLSIGNILSADFAFVCGTNLLSSHMAKYKQWNISLLDYFSFIFSGYPKKKLLDIHKFREHIRSENSKRAILLGAGWWQYQDAPDFYSRSLLKIFLSKDYLHSVRDSYTEKMLRSAGFENVINTACPTMWKLTEDFCRTLPEVKSSSVVTTFTNYNPNAEYDSQMMEILLSKYKTVYIWLQAIEDFRQLQQGQYFHRVKIIPPNLREYNAFLRETDADYIGTRLHGGIQALNYKHRALILAVDNRAMEISRDTALPVIKREELGSSLEKRISFPEEIRIRLPMENIRRWKAQFSSENF